MLTETERRKARWVTGVFFFLSGIISATWASRIPEIKQSLELNDAQWGGVLFAIPAGQVFGLPISSRIVSKYGSRPVMAFSMISFAAMLPLVALAGTVWVLVPLLFVFGLSRNLVNISINTHSLEVQQLYERPIVTTFHGLWSLAGLPAAGIGTLMIAQGAGPFVHFVLIGVLVALLTFLFKRKGLNTEQAAAVKRPFFVAPDRYLLLLGMIAFCAMICEITMFDWSVHYFRNVVAADKEKVTFGLTSFIMAMTAGRLLGDRLIARFGAATVLTVNGLLIAAGLCIAIVFPYLWPACAGFMLVGLGDSIIIPLVYTMAVKTKTMPPAYAIASVTMIGYTGFLSGPLVVGGISKAFGMQWSFALVGLLALAIAFLVRKVTAIGNKQ